MTPPTAVTDAPTVEGDPPQLTLDEQRAVLRSLDREASRRLHEFTRRGAMSRPPLDEVKHALLKNRAGQPLAAAHAELTRAVGLLLLEVIDRLDRLEQNSGGQ